jgi:CRP-like cAMP-binding protein
MSARDDLDGAAFPVLSASELSEIAAFGSERPISAGELLFEAGEASYDLFVILEGQIEIVRFDKPDAVVIAAYGPGGFAGELNLLTGQRRTLTCRVTQPGRVLVIGEAEFRRLMSVRPELAETLFNALLARRQVLRTGEGALAIRIVGSRYSPDAMSLRSFAEHSHLAHAWIDVEDAEDAESLLASIGLHLRPRGGWQRSGRALGCCVRRVGGPADRIAGRRDDRRSSRRELTDRELRGVSERHLRRRSHRASRRASDAPRRSPERTV